MVTKEMGKRQINSQLHGTAGERSADLLGVWLAIIYKNGFEPL